MRSYPRTEVLFTFVQKISTYGRLNSSTRCHSLCYGQKIKLNRIDFLHVSNRLRWCLETTSICIESTCIETTELHYESAYKLVTLRSQPPRLLVYMLRVRFPWFFISPSWEPQREWKRSNLCTEVISLSSSRKMQWYPNHECSVESSGIVMLAGTYGILDKNWQGIT